MIVRVDNGSGRYKAFEIRTSADINEADAIILPGGESTAMRIIGQALENRGDAFIKELRGFVASGRPVWGTCAGGILLSDHVSSLLGGGTNSNQLTLSSLRSAELYGDHHHIGGVGVCTCRNFFGRQTKSFETLALSDHPNFSKFNCVFIRAPAIASVQSPDVEELCHIDYNGERVLVAVREGNRLITCFHPELTSDDRIHKFFLGMIDD